ncbi:alpha/beta hydrolase fold domain-containing protein [Flavobacterium sp. Sd200]|uniref:alpha/beta hydrolase n=1 Tax=Flavobacterium sp. Sd200 TaxID=2692211 RepID=UPI00136F6B1C|nr:alpha/beta hydrolase [Flavobacterium sp. Sd200]MXN89651.1 alpha/beta hydrolase fold domain-containing protein [Flavobacterium sp. Sd200]
MKYPYVLILFIGLLFGCSSNDDTNNEVLNLPQESLVDVAYGPDPLQTMDVYLPANRNSTDTKVVIVVHGGSWVGGDKDDMAEAALLIQEEFPEHAIVNINYRLATTTSPAYPKQIEDIQQVVNFLKNSDYHISNQYAFLGASAGAHLAMLYSYKYDTAHEVKAVCNIVGPADFTDPAYVSHPLYPFAALIVLGTQNITPALIENVNPIAHITPQSPPTIMFYGGADELVPSSQGPRLKASLDAAGVYNEFNFYEEGGHADWDDATFAEVYAKLTAFFETRF